VDSSEIIKLFDYRNMGYFDRQPSDQGNASGTVSPKREVALYQNY
jgi:hypothetical protein